MSERTETEIKSMTKEQNYMCGYKDGKSDTVDKIRAEIMLLPITDTAVRLVTEILDKYKEALEERTGYWIKYDKEFYVVDRLKPVVHSIRECSECHTKIMSDFNGELKYCPNCNARMVKPQESEG